MCRLAITFNDFAKSNGFINVAYTTLPSANKKDTVYITVPSGASEGVFEANITFRNELGLESSTYTVAFTINLAKEYIAKKWDDVLVADNSTNRFVGYQWYKNGEPIEGATEQFYNDPEGISGSYFLAVTTVDGEALHTCSQFYEKVITRSASLSVYPNPVASNSTITVRFEDISPAELVGAVMSVYTTRGVLIYKTDVVEVNNTLHLTEGLYVGTVNTAAGEQFVFKVSVVE